MTDFLFSLLEPPSCIRLSGLAEFLSAKNIQLAKYVQPNISRKNYTGTH